MNIYQRINAVQKQVKYIKKDSVVSTGSGSYQAVSHDNVISELRGHLIEQGILVIPSLVSSEWFGRVRVKRNRLTGFIPLSSLSGFRIWMKRVTALN